MRPSSVSSPSPRTSLAGFCDRGASYAPLGARGTRVITFLDETGKGLTIVAHVRASFRSGYVGFDPSLNSVVVSNQGTDTSEM